MPPLPDRPAFFRYAPVTLVAAWGVAELGMLAIVWGGAPPGVEASETHGPLVVIGALPASGLIAAMLAFCSLQQWRQKVPWLVMSAGLFGVAISFGWHRSHLFVLMLGGVIGNAVWFAGFRVWGRSRLVMRGEPPAEPSPRLSTRQIMLLTLAASFLTAGLRLLAKHAPAEANIAMMGMAGVAAGIVVGAATLPLALAILQPHWAWWLIHWVANVGTMVFLIGVAAAWSTRLRSDQVGTAVAAWELVWAHFILFCAVLRTTGFRFRKH